MSSTSCSDAFDIYNLSASSLETEVIFGDVCTENGVKFGMIFFWLVVLIAFGFYFGILLCRNIRFESVKVSQWTLARRSLILLTLTCASKLPLFRSFLFSCVFLLSFFLSSSPFFLLLFFLLFLLLSFFLSFGVCVWAGFVSSCAQSQR